MLALAAVQAFVMALLVPAWMGEDEPWHLETALWVARGERPSFDLVPPSAIPAETWRAPVSHLLVQRRFPERSLAELGAMQASLLESLADHRFEQRVDWAPDVRGTTSFDALHPAITAADEPPLYAVLLGLWLWPFTGLSLEAQLTLARVPSALVYLLAVWAALRLGQRLSRDPRLAVTAGLVCALWPMHARQAAVVNNDVLAKAAVSLGVLFALALARPRVSNGGRARLALTLAVAPFTKPTAVSAFALAPTLLLGLGRSGRGRGAWRLALFALGGSVLLGVAFVVALAASPTVPAGLGELASRVQASVAPARLAELGRTAIGTFGWNQRFLPGPVYTLGAVIALVGVLGCATFARRLCDRRGAAAVGLMALAVFGAQLTLVLLRGATAGRYLFPAIAPFAALVALGWLALAPERQRGLAAGLLVTALLALDVSFLALGLTAEEWLRFAS